MKRIRVGKHELMPCPHCKAMLVVWVEPGPDGPLEMPCFKCSKPIEVHRVN